MNTKEFIKDLNDLIQKFNKSQGVVLLDIDLNAQVMYGSNIHATYDTKVKLG